jgi:hypothetical protein
MPSSVDAIAASPPNLATRELQSTSRYFAAVLSVIVGVRVRQPDEPSASTF